MRTEIISPIPSTQSYTDSLMQENREHIPAVQTSSTVRKKRRWPVYVAIGVTSAAVAGSALLPKNGETEQYDGIHKADKSVQPSPARPNVPDASKIAEKYIPPQYLQIYQDTMKKYPTIPWPTLAGIGKIESEHGQSGAKGVKSGVNWLGCCAGPMQFYINRKMARGTTTWDLWGKDYNKDGKKNVYDPEDAIPSAAAYLKGLKYDSQKKAKSICNTKKYPLGTTAEKNALWGYNRSCQYGQNVLKWAAEYKG